MNKFFSFLLFALFVFPVSAFAAVDEKLKTELDSVVNEAFSFQKAGEYSMNVHVQNETTGNVSLKTEAFVNPEKKELEGSIAASLETEEMAVDVQFSGKAVNNVLYGKLEKIDIPELILTQEDKKLMKNWYQLDGLTTDELIELSKKSFEETWNEEKNMDYTSIRKRSNVISEKYFFKFADDTGKGTGKFLKNKKTGKVTLKMSGVDEKAGKLRLQIQFMPKMQSVTAPENAEKIPFLKENVEKIMNPDL